LASHPLRAFLGRVIATRRRSPGSDGLPSPTGEEQPLRAELFSVDQLARHAAELAMTHQLARGVGSDRLIPRLDENERILVETYHLVTAAAGGTRHISPAAEWLLDNFYLIEDQIRLTRRNLPRSYSRELPRLAIGPDAGYPRAYAIALELIAHVDGRFDLDSLNSFIAAYKPAHPLHLGELWAIPIMLGLALIENLRRVSARVAAGRRDRDRADDWAERMVEVVERNPSDLVLVLADMARADPPLTGAFLSQLTRHLQGQSAHFTFANSWLEHRLSEHGQTTERLILAEGQAQAADQISMGNCITSLRFLGANDWREFVEAHSQVEQVLRTDPARVYARMDFATRDRYRHAIEEIAKRSPLEEYQIAGEAIDLARAALPAAVRAVEGEVATVPTDTLGAEIPAGSASSAAAKSSEVSEVPEIPAVPEPSPVSRDAHVGYYLIDQGRRTLELRARMRATWGIPGAPRTPVTALLLRPWHLRGDAGSDDRLRRSLARPPVAPGAAPARLALEPGSGPAGAAARVVRHAPGGGVHQLAGHAGGAGPAAGPAGLQRRHPRGLPNHDRGADHARQRGRRQGAPGGAGGEVPGQPGRQSSLCAAHRPHRRHARGTSHG